MLLLALSIALSFPIGSVDPQALTVALNAPETEFVRLSDDRYPVLRDADDIPERAFARLVSAVRLGDGSLVLAEAQSRELRHFAPSGAFLATLAKRGRGPGEFEGFAWVSRLARDTLVVYDRTQRRVSLLTSGGVGRQWSLSDLGQFDTPVDAVGFGAKGELVLRRTLSTPTASGAARSEDELFAIQLASGQRRVIAAIRGDEVFSRASSQGRRVLASPPFRRQTFVAVASAGIAIGDSETGALTLSPAAASSTRDILVSDGDRSLTEVGVRARLDFLWGDRASDRRADWELLQREMLDGALFPAFAGLYLTDDGEVWVRHFERTLVHRQRWTVLDQRGRIRGRFELPGRCILTQVADQTVTCVGESDEGRVFVRSLRLPSP